MADNYTFEERAGRTGAAKDIGSNVLAARVQPIQGTSDVTAANPLQVEDVNAVNVVAAPGAALPTGRMILGAGNGANADGLISDGIGGLRVRTGANVIDLAASFSRPADTTAYADGDLVANNTAAASVSPLSWAIARNNNDGLSITGARMNKSQQGAANATFWLHLFKADPTATNPINGDNGAMVLNTDSSDYLGSMKFDFTTDCPDIYNAAHVCNGEWLQGRQDVLGRTGASTTTIYGLLQAKAAYAPASGETFEVFLEAIQS